MASRFYNHRLEKVDVLVLLKVNYFTKVGQKMAKLLAKEGVFGLMDKFMRDSGKMVKSMDLENYSTHKGLSVRGEVFRCWEVSIN